ncbi:MAG: DNA-directed RNA polymerase subunit D [Candidatus Methanospirareceae archaeon]
MEVKILEKEGLFLRFLLSGVKTSFANALRRAMIAEVPKMAIDEVHVYENTSLLYDEQLALRLGLIPLKTDLKSYVPHDECECEGGCQFCQVSLRLSAESPKEVGSIMVYSKDLISTDPEIVPVYDNIPIVKLISKEIKIGNLKLISRQKILIEAIARMGRGKEHAKWQPVTVCGYKNMPRIEIKDCNGCGDCVEACPKGILRIREIDKTLVVNDIIECSLCKLCEEACDEKAIKVDIDKNSFIFNVESDGSLPVEEIVKEAVRVLKEKCKKLEKEVGELMEKWGG